MWRRSVNTALARVTGLELRRAGEAEPAHPGNERQLQDLRARLKRAEQRNERLRRRLDEVRAKAVPDHYDEGAVTILRRVEPRTMTDHAKLFGLVEATRYLVRHDIPGDVVECGVWRGGSMQAVALALQELGSTDRALHLFDTFEGMPPPSEKDRRRGVTAEEMLATHDRDHRIWAIASLDDVREAMEEVGYPPEHVHYHQGMVEDTIPGMAPERISLLRLDTDWYESTRHELEHLYDRLSPGGVLILDDYGDWEGARQATDEFLATLPDPVMLHPLGTGRMAVKPLR